MAKDEPRTFPVDNHVPFDGRGMSKAYLSNGTPMKLFFDSGASRSYLSKRFYDSNPVLHDMPKFVTTCTGIRIGNCTRSRLVLLWLIYLKCIVDFIVLLFYIWHGLCRPVRIFIRRCF